MAILPYNPSSCAPEVLEAITVGQTRKNLHETLFEALVDELEKEIHQHHLLIGSRGSGKSHTLSLLLHRLESSQELSEKVVPIPFAEEESIPSMADFLIKILKRLENELASPRLLKYGIGIKAQLRQHLEILSYEDDDEKAFELAKFAIEEMADLMSCTFVIFIENLDAILYTGTSGKKKKAFSAQWKLRSLLQQSQHILIFATAPTSFGEITDPDASFYNFFRVHHLNELSNDEMLALIRQRLEQEIDSATTPSEREKFESLKNNFGSKEAKLQSILLLTGGLPRFGHLLFDLIVQDETSQVHELLARFLDEQTPYFQSRFNPRDLQGPESEIIELIATAPNPLTPSTMSKQIRGMNNNTLSTYLGRLVEKGFLRKKTVSRREVYYDLTEPLYRLWRRFRLSRSIKAQISLLAEFLAVLFEPEELEEERKKLKQMEHDPKRLLFIEAMLSFLHQEKPLNTPDTTPTHELWLLAKEIQHFLKEYSKQTLAYLEQAKTSTKEPTKETQPFSFVEWSITMPARSEKYKRALELLEKAKKIDSKASEISAIFSLLVVKGQLLHTIGKHKQSLEVYSKAEQLYKKEDLRAPDMLVGLYNFQMFSLMALNKKAEAVISGEKAIQLLEENPASQMFAPTLDYQSTIYIILEQFDEALELSRRAIQLLTAEKTTEAAQQIALIKGKISQIHAQRGDWKLGVAVLFEAQIQAEKAQQSKIVEKLYSDFIDSLTKHTLQKTLEQQELKNLLYLLAPELQKLSSKKAVIHSFSYFVVFLFTKKSSEDILDLISFLSPLLADNFDSILKLLKLAAEIEKETRTIELPEQTEETGRIIEMLLKFKAESIKETTLTQPRL